MTDDKKQIARQYMWKLKGGDYIHGLGCMDQLGNQVIQVGKRASVVISGFGKEWGGELHDNTRRTLAEAGVAFAGDFIPGARPNAPREDVRQIAEALGEQDPEVVVAVGGGSGLDATKAAVAYLALRDEHTLIDDYIGIGRVSEMLEETGRSLIPIVTAQLASGSASHLTMYSNITDLEKAQKLLIIDDALLPAKCLFDYAMTATMSSDFTKDGALDGVAHSLEVYYGISDDRVNDLEPVALLGIELIINNLKSACDNLEDLEAREALGLGTDLGGYSIMVGGTSGAHLTSFSLVDVLSHGRACALMNPYYTVFFAPAIEDRLRKVGDVYKKAGFTNVDLGSVSGRDLGLAVADAMVAFANDIGFPTTLSEVPGFTRDHITRALTAAKDPKLDMKLKNMPVPLSAETVDDYMGPILEAAVVGDFGLIKNLG